MFQFLGSNKFVKDITVVIQEEELEFHNIPEIRELTEVSHADTNRQQI